MIDRLTELGKAFFIFGHSGVIDAAFVEVFGVVEDLEAVFFDFFDGEFKEGVVIGLECDYAVFFEQFFISVEVVL